MAIRKNSILYGTAVLTFTGFLTRIIGFFYRIFLSHEFGEEGMGLFQLTSPILSFSYAIAISGIQTAISKYVAEKSSNAKSSMLKVFLGGLILSLSLSCTCALIIFVFANPIAVYALKEERCEPLIRILALSLPFGAVHSCINGYFLGKKSTVVPSLSQLIEQIFRVGSVFLISYLYTLSGKNATLSLTAIGLLIGEIASGVFSFFFLWKDASNIHLAPKIDALKNNISSLLQMSVPLSVNRIIVTIFLSLETVTLPLQLQVFGMDHATALGCYGVLSGMALPLILFPCAVTNSLSVLLLPTVSKAQSTNSEAQIQRLVQKSFFFCFLMGLLATLLFFFGGNFLGKLLFHSDTAGFYIIRLSFICPLLYITSTLGGIINGLGKTKSTLCIQVVGLSTRLLFVFFIVKRTGIDGYMLGLIVSQFLSCIQSMFILRKYFIPTDKSATDYSSMANH